MNLGTVWTVIGSTSSVAAQDHTGTNPGLTASIPIYLSDGATKIADNNVDLWDESIDNPLYVLASSVWAGSSTKRKGFIVLGSVTQLPGRCAAAEIWWEQKALPLNNAIFCLLML